MVNYHLQYNLKIKQKIIQFIISMVLIYMTKLKTSIYIPSCNKKGTFMIGRLPSTGQLILNVYHPQSTKLNDVEYFSLVKQCFKEYRLA